MQPVQVGVQLAKQAFHLTKHVVRIQLAAQDIRDSLGQTPRRLSNICAVQLAIFQTSSIIRLSAECVTVHPAVFPVGSGIQARMSREDTNCKNARE